VSESLIAWWQILPVAIESKSSNYRSQYLMTEFWFRASPDDAIKVMLGAGAGRHKSSFGDDGWGSAVEGTVDLRLAGDGGVSLRWQTHVIKSLTGEHEPFAAAGLPAGRYRPLLVSTSLGLWAW
jgi:hypothetical protein